jgi:hypothetical protein
MINSLSATISEAVKVIDYLRRGKYPVEAIVVLLNSKREPFSFEYQYNEHVGTGAAFVTLGGVKIWEGA